MTKILFLTALLVAVVLAGPASDRITSLPGMDLLQQTTRLRSLRYQKAVLLVWRARTNPRPTLCCLAERRPRLQQPVRQLSENGVHYMPWRFRVERSLDHQRQRVYMESAGVGFSRHQPAYSVERQQHSRCPYQFLQNGLSFPEFKSTRCSWR